MTNNLVYGFLDESPSLNDQSFFFCVDIISTSEKTNKHLQNIIKRARKKIVKKQIKQLSELKFHNSDRKTRDYVLTEIAKSNVEIVVIVINKEHRKIADSPLNYGIAIGVVIAENLLIHPMLNITMDKKFTNKDDEKEFLAISQKMINMVISNNKGNKSIVFNPPADSKNEPLLQLADFVAGAMNAKYNNRDTHYSEIIHSKISVEKEIKWTETKKRIVNP